MPQSPPFEDFSCEVAIVRAFDSLEGRAHTTSRRASELLPVPSRSSRAGLDILRFAPRAAASAFLFLPGAAFAVAETAGMTFEPRGITPEDSVIFVIGCVPFVWAGIEFWRRIAVGDPFGTGTDSVIINDTSGNRPKPVRRVLGTDAIIAARILFALAFASGVLVVIAGVDVVGSSAR